MTKHQRAEAADQHVVSLALSLCLGAVADRNKKIRRAAPAGGGGDQFVCKTCGRSFPSFQALGGHRTSHLRGRHGLALALTTGDQYYSVKPKSTTDQKQGHQCHICGQGFETGQALGGHMRRHRDETAQAPPVLLELFV